MSSPIELICKKRDGGNLTAAQLHSFFSAYLQGQLQDYQVSAMLMAIAINGMSREETAALTKLMRDSGIVLKWKFPKELVVDKHSTGGIGDKTSLILLPLCVLEGLKVPMMSGRGLGHTGGTLDKLESIPGTKVQLPIDRANQIVEKYGGVFIGQTSELAPLDKRLYALRDVTGTVESIPLITASILSKKTAEGIGNLVMDVKHGSGAFMQEITSARKLAESLGNVGKECGINIRCLLTNMDSPLGRSAGNNLEIKECIEILQGGGPEDTRTLSVELSAEMIEMADPRLKKAEIVKRLENHLTSGKAYEAFKTIIGEQGGDISCLDNPHKLPEAKFKKAVVSNKDGCVSAINVRDLGLAIVALGGGRRATTDKIDPAVGLTGMKHVGEKISAGEALATVHANDQRQLEEALHIVGAAYQVGDKAASYRLITERIV